MKNLISFAVLTVFACSSVVFAQNTTKNVKLNEEFSIAAKQKGYVKSDKLTIEFVSVLEDSRCPEDVDCVWAGSAKIQIKVSKGKSAAKIFELNTNLEPQFITFQGYKIEIIDLSPQLKSEEDKSKVKYAAKFMIMKK